MIGIYRMMPGVTAANAHEDGAAGVERIELGPGAGPPNGAALPAGYANTAPVVRMISAGPKRHDSENPSPLLDELRRPDISYGGVEYTITINVPVGSLRYDAQSETLKQLNRWLHESSTIKKTFPSGRYGLRNDAYPFLDCEPDATAGYQLAAAPANWDMAIDSFIPVTLTLRHVGDSGRLNTGWRRRRDGKDPDSPNAGAVYERGANGVRP